MLIWFNYIIIIFFMFEYKKLKNIRNISVLSSIFKFVVMQQLDNIILFFVVKNKNKNQVLFLFLILYLLLNKKPNILVKKRKRLKLKFVGFYSVESFNVLYRLFLLYIPILDTIPSISSTIKNQEVYLVFDEFPIIYEVDSLCEKQNILLDYIINFKWILNIKLKKFYSNFFLECNIRLFKLSFINSF